MAGVPECDNDADDGAPADIAVATVSLLGRLCTCGIFLAAFREWVLMSLTITESR